VLLSKKVSTLPPRLFLMRWRKDLKQTYILLKSSYGNFCSNFDDERCDSLCKNLNELALLASKGTHIYTKVMKGVNVECSELRPDPIIRSHHISAIVASSSCNEVVQSNEASALQSNNVLSHIKVKCKGRPPIRRKVPIVEKVAKNKP
jgi:hypothetical protein